MARCPGIRRGSQRSWRLRAMAGLTVGPSRCEWAVPANATATPLARAARDLLATSYTVSLAHVAGCGPDTLALQAGVRGGAQTWDDVDATLVRTNVLTRRRMAPVLIASSARRDVAASAE